MDLKFKKYFTLNGGICSLYLLSPSHGISKIFKYIYEEINHSPCTQLFSMEKYVNYKNQVESKPIINVVIHEDEPTLATVIQFLTNLLIYENWFPIIECIGCQNGKMRLRIS